MPKKSSENSPINWAQEEQPLEHLSSLENFNSHIASETDPARKERLERYLAICADRLTTKG